jgi:hypothetical protein
MQRQQQMQQLAVLPHSQFTKVTAADGSNVAAAADAQLEFLPLLDANSSSKRDQIQRGYVCNGNGSDGAAGSSNRVVVGSGIQQHVQRVDQQQQHIEEQQQQQHDDDDDDDEVQRLRQRHAGMLRLGVLMTITLTIHNLPEVSWQRCMNPCHMRLNGRKPWC